VTLLSITDLLKVFTQVLDKMFQVSPHIPHGNNVGVLPISHRVTLLFERTDSTMSTDSRKDNLGELHIHHKNLKFLTYAKQKKIFFCLA